MSDNLDKMEKAYGKMQDVSKQLDVDFETLTKTEKDYFIKTLELCEDIASDNWFYLKPILIKKQ